MLYAVPVPSTIAKGAIIGLDTSAAEKMPGVKAVFHRENIGHFFRVPPTPDFSILIDERRTPFEDDVIRYYGQYVALAVAESLEQAQAAADAVKVTYKEETPDVASKLTAARRTESRQPTGRRRRRFQQCAGQDRSDLCNASRNP